MNNFILLLQIIVAVALAGAILIQVKGTGLGRVWGGGSSFSRRGLENLLFKGTFVLAAVFIILSATNLLI